MYYRKIYYLLFIILISGSFVHGNENTKQLADFESPGDNKVWLAIKPPRKECRNVEMSISSKYRSQGENSLKVKFTKHQYDMFHDVVLVPSIDNRALKTTDWTPYRRLLIDVYNPSSKIVRLHLYIYDTEYNQKYMRRYILTPEWNKIIIPMRDLAKNKINLAKIAELAFCVKRPQSDIVLYMDNLLLTKEGGTPWKSASDILSNSIIKLKAFQKSLANDIDKVTDVNNKLKSKKGNYQVLVKNTNAVLEELCDNSIGTVGALGIPEQEMSGVTSSSVNCKRKIEIATLELFSGKLKTVLAEKKLLNRLEENSSDWGIGQVKLSDIDDIRYSPRTYDGDLISRVSVSSCKNATESFCLLVIPKKTAIRNLQLHISDLKGKSGKNIISADNIQVSPLAYRIDHFKNAAFAYLLRPDVLKVDVPVNSQQAFWINIKVPEGVAAGDFSGEILFRADGVKPQKVSVNLKVYDFCLPKIPTLPLVIHSNSYRVKADALDVMAHHCEAGSIYANKTPTMEQIELWNKNGAQMINLLRISRMGKGIWKLDKNGKKVDFSVPRRKYIFKNLRRIVPQIKEKNLINKCFVYGFDEPTVDMLPVMGKIYDEIKKEFGLKTMFATYRPIWEDGEIKNVDYWAVAWFLLTPETIEKLKKRNIKIFAYNLATAGAQARLQFWSAFKSGMDGLLHYKLNSSNDISSKTAFPLVEAKLGGVRMPDVAGMKNYNTIGFEMWRQGSEDYEYLCLLRNDIKKIENNPVLAEKNAQILFEAKAVLFWIDQTVPAINEVRNSKVSLEIIYGFKERIVKIIEKLEYALKENSENDRRLH